MAVSPVVSGQTGSFSVTLTSPNPVHGINGRMIFDPAMMPDVVLSLNASQLGFKFAQNSPAPGEICFVLYKIPADAALPLPNPVVDLSFTAPADLLGSAYASIEFESDAAARIMPLPDDDVVSVGMGGPGGTPPARTVNFGSFTIPIIGRPIISPAPTSQSVNTGLSVSFFIGASGPGQPFTYQWFGPSGLLSGENNPTLNLNSIDGADAGLYRCDVTNVAGTSSSANATLTVNSPAQLNSASFISSSIPNPVHGGQAVYIGVTMRNTSILTWSQLQGYALAVTSDPHNLFGGVTRFYFPTPVVLSNANALFIPFLTAPQAPGSYSASVRMVQENIEFFGPTAQLTINVVTPLNATRAWELYE